MKKMSMIILVIITVLVGYFSSKNILAKSINNNNLLAISNKSTCDIANKRQKKLYDDYLKKHEKCKTAIAHSVQERLNCFNNAKSNYFEKLKNLRAHYYDKCR